MVEKKMMMVVDHSCRIRIIPNIIIYLLTPVFMVQLVTPVYLLIICVIIGIVHAYKTYNTFDNKTDEGVYLVSSDSFSHSEGEVNSMNLPEDILFNIAARLNGHKDFIRFGAVCGLCKTVYTNIQRLRAPSVPLLILATELNNDNQTRSFYSFTARKVCNSKVQVPHNRYTPGSSKGWVFTVCTKTLRVSLFNPFLSSKNEIQLPPLTTFEHDDIEDFYLGYIKKVAWSANPTSPDNVVVAINNPRQQMSFFKHGDNAWTSIDAKYCGFSDVIYYRDQFYAVNQLQGWVFAFDLNHPRPRVTRFAPSTPISPPNVEDMRYLVDAFGDILQVVRMVGFESMDNENDGDNEEEDSDEEPEPTKYFTKGFIVYKWDLDNLVWIRLFHLDGFIVFVGNNSSLCVLVSKFPECKQNSIYFTDDYYNSFILDQEREDIDGPHDEGVFCFDDGTIESINPTKSNLIYPAPIWIEQPLTFE